MAAGAFNMYNNSKRYLTDGTVDVDTDAIICSLFKNDSNCSTFTLSLSTELTNPVSTGGAGPQTLTITLNDTGLSTLVSAPALVWTASAADMTSIQFLVIREDGGKLICWCELSTANFNVTTNNTLTVTFAGLFSMQ
jgi:hypothetical protein